MDKLYKSLLWSFGEKPERSMKRNEEENNNDTKMEINNMISNNITMIENVNTNMSMSMSISQLGEFRKANNKREIVNSKLDERYSIGNIGQNPFNRENNYIKDLENQQKFMIPKSSYDEKM
jgi:hypothetical protein